MSAVGRSLDEAMARFSRLLRERGLGVTASESLDALRALEAVGLGDREEVRLALRTVFTGRPEDLPVFDRCFEAFWRLATTPDPHDNNAFEIPEEPQPARARRAAAEPRRQTPEGILRATARTVGLAEWEDDAPGGDDEAPLETAAMSDSPALVEKDFSAFTADELPEVTRLTRWLARRLATGPGRRRRPGRRGTIDIRRSARASLSKGELIELTYRRRRPKKARLVVLCDVSGSMDLYSRFLIQFLYALQNVFGGMETFVFSTALSRVTGHLRRRSFSSAVLRLGAVRDWSGGTRIGENLERFNRDFGVKLVDRRTLVLILSDGWDTGDPELLARELLAVRRRAAKLVWLNPLLGQPSYEPLTRGMAAALPIVHEFLPAHNLASLRELGRHLRL